MKTITSSTYRLSPYEIETTDGTQLSTESVMDYGACQCPQNGWWGTVPPYCPVHTPYYTIPYIPYNSTPVTTIIITGDNKAMSTQDVKNKMINKLVEIIDNGSTSNEDAIKAIELLNSLINRP